MPASDRKTDAPAAPVLDESLVEAGLRGRGPLWFLADTDAFLSRYVLAEVLGRPRALARPKIGGVPPMMRKQG